MPSALVKLQTQVPFPRFPNVAMKLGLDVFNLAGGVIAENFDGDADLEIADL